MKKTRLLLAGFMAAIMAASMLSACASKPEAESAGGTGEAASSTATAAAGPFGKYDSPITISVVKDSGQNILEFPEGDSLEENVWTRYFKDEMNIDFKMLWTTNSQQYEQKVNIAITSDDIPDVMKVKNTQLKMMYDNEQLMDLTDVYSEYASDYTKEVMSSDGGFGLDSATFDGRLMAIPKVESNLFSSNILWIRTDWLEKLKLEKPKTVEDFMKVADAFTTQDPDGNGKNDTFGLAIYKDLFASGYAQAEGFFNMFNAYPNIWIDKEGKLANGSVQPEVKDALAALQDMYSKGYIDPEFGVKDANKVNEDVNAGKAGMMFGNFWNAAWINDAKVNDPTFEWDPIALPGKDGTAKTQLSFGTSYYYVVSKKCEHPEAAIKMLNGYLDKSYGEHAEPTKFNITPEGYGPYDYPVITMEPPMKNFVAAQKVSAALESGNTDELNEEEKNYYEMAKLSLDGDHSNNNWHQLKMFGPGGSFEVINKYWEDETIVQDQYFGPPTPAMTEKKSTLDKQQLTDFTSIILGGSIDDFDKFVQNWESLGGADITKEVNEWYAKQ